MTIVLLVLWPYHGSDRELPKDQVACTLHEPLATTEAQSGAQQPGHCSIATGLTKEGSPAFRALLATAWRPSFCVNATEKARLSASCSKVGRGTSCFLTCKDKYEQLPYSKLFIDAKWPH